MELINCHNCKGTGNTSLSLCHVCNGQGAYQTITLYRYFDIIGPHAIELRCDEFKTIKHTSSGYWINWSPKPKFISRYTDKRWAYDTKEAALNSYYRRKKKQVKILKAQLERAEKAVELTPENPNSDGSPYSDPFSFNN